MAIIYYPSGAKVIERNTVSGSQVVEVLSVFPNSIFYFDQSGSLQQMSQSIIADTASYALFAVTANTSSYALNAVSASYVLLAKSASYVLLADSASYVLLAKSASYVLQAVSASFASQTPSASYSQKTDSASFATTASWANNVPATASYALYAITSSVISGSQNGAIQWFSYPLYSSSIYHNTTNELSTSFGGPIKKVSVYYQCSGSSDNNYQTGSMISLQQVQNSINMKYTADTAGGASPTPPAFISTGWDSTTFWMISSRNLQILELMVFPYRYNTAGNVFSPDYHKWQYLFEVTYQS